MKAAQRQQSGPPAQLRIAHAVEPAFPGWREMAVGRSGRRWAGAVAFPGGSPHNGVVLVFLNGRFVPQERAVVSVFDRGFLYGDGLFETLRVQDGHPLFWEAHLARLRFSAEFLGIQIPFSPDELHRAALELIRRNRLPAALLRLSLSRGVGPRGYSPRGADRPTLVMSLHPAPAPPGRVPPRWKLVTAALRVPAGDVLAQHKTCAKLPHILARAEAEARGADEALLLNTNGHVAEATSGNVFWIEGRTICTPPLGSTGILLGVTRSAVRVLCRQLGLPCREKSITPARLLRTDGVFLTLSSLGIVAVTSLDGRRLRRSPLITRLHQEYWAQH